MLSFILAVVLMQAQPSYVYNARSNIFEPSEVSSEFVFVSLHVCFLERGGYSKEKVPLCGCLVDAQRLNAKMGLTPMSATPEQVKRCEAALAPRPPPQKPSKGKIGT